MKILFNTLILFIFIGFSAIAQNKKLKIISYNVYVGMSSDKTEGKKEFAEWFKQQNPDIVALQEVTGFTQTSLEKFAQSYGHPYAVLLVEGEKYPVAFTSKYPITNVKKVIDNMDRGFIQANILGQTFIVLHLSPFDYQTRRNEVDLVLATIKNNPSIKNWVVMGDFNSFAAIDSLAYTDGELIANLKKYEQKYAPIRKLVDNKIDYYVINRMNQSNFYDALKLFHKDFVKTVHPKHFAPVGLPDVPTRIDFVFVSKGLKKNVKSAEVLVDEFTDSHSDHYPMMIELQLKK
ncbi:endonuclease/exonuclease/phosphatase family protein [Pedobacter arcticus]|uniref:endonuclease/exonuclease/phosphatase family protein n=1 Tax=Pedobacter arcticus TaxID=752140 RepID=UPI0002E827E3|nr:endonuclease/exonuclease/phosphatase family protein [Pedobacter arcticus]